jgi:hypothetical protein
VKSASNTLPDQSDQRPGRLPEDPVNGVTGGIDWARDDYAVSVVDSRGREIFRCTVEHTAASLRELVTAVIDTPLNAGLTVVVISPNQVKNLRGRYGSAGNKDDRFDAFVLADTLPGAGRVRAARLLAEIDDYRARDRGHDHPHAVRILARAWLYVIWHCWQDGVAYDPSTHKALQRVLASQHASETRAA